MLFVFDQPNWLWGLLSIPLGVYWLLGYLRWRNTALKGRSQLVTMPSKRVFWLKNAFFLLCIALLCIAWANPIWQGKAIQQKQEAADVMIALDISRSMLSDDLKPNRLVRARLLAQELVREIAGNRVGLILFAGDAFLSMPLSTDYATVNNFLAEADPESFSAQGTAIESVVRMAQKSYDPEGGGRALVIITDGEDHEDSSSDVIAEALSEDGIFSYMVGVGTAAGGNIPMPGSRGLLRDGNNEVVVTKLNVEMLQEMAQAGGGNPVYYVANDGNTAQKIAAEINGLKKKEVSVRSMANKESGYQWLLLPAILLLVLFMGWPMVFRK